MQQARGKQAAAREMRPRFKQVSRESSRVDGAHRLAGGPQGRQSGFPTLIAWLPSNQELRYSAAHDGRAFPTPDSFAISGHTSPRGENRHGAFAVPQRYIMKRGRELENILRYR